MAIEPTTNPRVRTVSGEGAAIPGAQPSGLIFGKYEIIRRLALGGMGEVFLARQIGVAFERLVILKSLLPELAEQEDFVHQFLDEARVAAQLNHPNIVGIFEVGLWNGVYFIAMEYIHGTDISKLQRAALKQQRSIPYQVSARIVMDAASGLDHAHHATTMTGEELHIVHRDISPQNIMVRQDGVTKVVDFGIAKATNRASRTATGMLKGKLQYMAPEQVSGQSIDARADQFALGAVLWELTTNQRLFKGENELQTFEKILKGRIPRPSDVVPGYPPDLENVIMRMLERAPDRRYARLADAARDLRQYLDACSRSVSEQEVATFVKDVMGEELAAVTRDLTPTAQNFMISLESGPHARSPGGTPTTLTRGLELKKKRTGAMAMGALAAVVVTSAAAYVLFGGDDPAVPSARALPEDPTVTPGGTATPAGTAPSVTPKPNIKKRRPLKAGQPETDIEIDSPAGATIIVDGTPWGEKVPTVVKGLTPGPHKIVIEHEGERVEESVTLDGPKKPSRIVITSKPSKATVFLGPRAMGTTPLTLDDLEPGSAYAFSVEKRGYEAASVELTLGEGEIVERVATLVKRAATAKAEPKAPPPSSSTTPDIVYVDRVVEKKQDPPGEFTVKTTPWAKIWIDGQPHGSTPLFKKPLQPGKHNVRLVNEGAGVDVTKTITIKSREHLKQDWTLK